jgi:homoserine acetyltransferase
VAAEYVEIDSPHGHDAFLIDLQQVGGPITRWLHNAQTD